MMVMIKHWWKKSEKKKENDWALRHVQRSVTWILSLRHGCLNLNHTQLRANQLNNWVLINWISVSSHPSHILVWPGSYHIILQEQQQEYHQQNEKLRDMVQIYCRPSTIPGWAMGTDLIFPLAYVRIVPYPYDMEIWYIYVLIFDST